MLTPEVREWLKKVERRQYSYDDAIYEFTRFMPYLSREDIMFLKSKLEAEYKR